MSLERLNVSIWLNGQQQAVGELAARKDKIYFKYHPDFLDLGIEISPYKMRLSPNTLSAESGFDGLFGVFNDSLPDAWGRLLLDRALRSKGMAPFDINALNRLAFVGNKGFGALTYSPPMDDESNTNHEFDIDELVLDSQKLIQGAPVDLLDELYALGSSSGGARPKVLVGYNSLSNHLLGMVNNLPNGYEHWIIKFPSRYDLPDIANIEFAYAQMAQACGIEMSECRLFEGKSGDPYFGTKRFDREGNQRVHMHSLSGLLHDDFSRSNLDYGHLMNCAFELEKSVKAYRKVLRLAAFNVFAHNRDDHSKNFAFLMNADGSWKLAPAYDLTYSSSSHGEHSTTINQEGRKPGKTQLLQLAEYFGMGRDGSLIIEEVLDCTNQWKHFARKCGVTKNSELIIENGLALIRTN